ncbi:tetratricopeptide repeat protein [Pseudomonas juntendi]|uniref:tetratricopeptide repeat protein n=2 Tax=Gammaproteobacteria TaxID=1236 RepID=UPI001FFDE377|nr:hypothetical protein [Pseudomonas juntendi]MCK2111302.1 hypothetical protein [Pseudomonas juntendi]MCK2115219.1 hypothetical protein [Pseudomonas juntendi]
MPTELTKKLQIVGHLDYVDNGVAYGWALDPSNPRERVTVEILCDGKVVGHGIADGYREDLKDAGVGDGYHLFQIKLSYELYDGEAHTLQARNTSKNILLTGSNLILPPQPVKFSYPLISRSEGEEWISQLYSAHATPTANGDRSKVIQAYRIASLFQETGQYDDARYAWEALTKVLGENAYCTCKLAESYLLEEKSVIALDLYQRAAGLNLNFSWAHLGISVCQRLMGNIIAAENSLAFAQALPKRGEIAKHLQLVSMDLLPNRVERLIAQKDRAGALELLYKILLSNPQQMYATEKLNSLLAEEIQHTGSKTTESLLIANRRAVRLLEMTMDLASGSPSPLLKLGNEADKHNV